MKGVILFIIFLAANSIFAQQGWVKLLGPSISFYEKIQFTDNQTGYLIGYVNNNFRLYKTTNLGNDWNDLLVPVNFYSNSFHFLNSNVGIISGRINSNAAFYKTTNGGNNWNQVFVEDSSVWSNYVHISFIDYSTGYIAGSNSYQNYYIYKTTDAANSWARIQNATPTIYNISFPMSNFGIILSSAATIFKTTNGGVNWNLKLAGVTDYLSDQQWMDSATGYVSGNNLLILKTTNMGENWNTIHFLPGSYTNITSIAFTSLDTGYHVRSYSQSKIYKTTNGGYNWLMQNTTYTNNLREIYFLNKDTGFAIGDNIILRTTNGGGPIGIIPISSEIPNKFSLHQNYPNPFNPVTKIKFEVPAENGRDHSTLIIYDALGREVTTLVNEKLNVGVYSVDWNGANYPSGVYLYRLASGSYTETKKMVLIK
jgi:photosystem II stability/assembly factor-like uncharacterized protein